MSRPRPRAAACDVALPLLVYGAATAWFTWPLASVGVNHLVTSSAALLNDLYLASPRPSICSATCRSFCRSGSPATTRSSP